MNEKLYLFSGLGADERVFRDIHFEGLTITYIKWIIPFENESIEHYASRLLNQINTNNPILIGLSFGGIMAIEVAKLIETKKVILIASAKTKYEIPFYYRLAGKAKLHKLIPTAVLKKSNFITNWLFGVSSVMYKDLLKSILMDTGPIFFKWAIDKIVCWDNIEVLQNVKHIHGTSDRILPFCFVKSDYKVLNGGHFMTLDKSTELTQLIKGLI